MKTASRILGSAFFLEGYEVQDAPRYGAERRGAPIFAYVRADRSAIYERGIIKSPDLAVIADDTLIAVPAAGILAGLTEQTVLLISTHEQLETWRNRIKYLGLIVTLPAFDVENPTEAPYVGATCAGAAARLIGAITWPPLEMAIRQELAEFSEEVIDENINRARAAYEQVADHAGCVREGHVMAVHEHPTPRWVNLVAEDPLRSAPAIHASANSVEVRTGLWRTMRPVIDYDHCNRCSWICSSFCPDSAINTDPDGTPRIDYDHCKGCMICVAQCPPHAIAAIPEQNAAAPEQSNHEQSSQAGRPS